MAPTRQEPGCIRYTLHVNRDDPADFWFIETWADQAALDRHMSTPETADLVRKLDRLLIAPATLYTLTRIS